MALIVEDGTGKSDAESYATVAQADTRHTNLGNTAWGSLSTTVKEQLLRKATNYMLQKYRDAWKGSRVLATQALDFPRFGIVIDEWIDIANNVVPVDIINACIDLALEANSGALLSNQTQQVIRKKIGPIEKTFDPNSPQSTQYRSIESMLAPYLENAGGNAIEMVRT